MTNESYQKLVNHLSRLPGGFTPSETGSDIKLLQRIFTPEEAELAVHLSLEHEKPQTIAERANLSIGETEKRLEEMANKGLIFSVHSEDGSLLYHTAPWVVGIYELQVNNLTEGFLEDLVDYYKTRKSESPVKTIPQFRTIPINQSIDTPLKVLPYEQIKTLVDAHNKFAVAPCICRRREKKLGRGCDAPEETCLFFGDFAEHYVRAGLGREIEKSEVEDILTKANEANLVLNPTNSKYVAAICSCCSCCCGVLGDLQRQDKPSEAVASSFIVDYVQDNCIGCGVCVDRCQMKAFTLENAFVSFDSDRCIGCGLCVSTCPSGALSLVRKPDGELKETPDTLYDTWYTIVKDKAMQ
jgi:ferredoxin